MKIFNVSYFYTLRECYGQWLEGNVDYFANYPQLSILLGEQLSTAFGTVYNITLSSQNVIIDSLPFFSWDSVNNEYVLDDTAKDILNAVSQRYCENYCAWCTASEDEEKTINNVLDRILLVLKNTWEKYSTLIGLYEANKTKLMDGIKISGTTIGRIKDTPQSDINPLSNAYNSAVSSNESETYDERDSMIARLDEISAKMKQLVKDWTDEFGSIFLDNANI